MPREALGTRVLAQLAAAARRPTPCARQIGPHADDELRDARADVAEARVGARKQCGTRRRRSARRSRRPPRSPRRPAASTPRCSGCDRRSPMTSWRGRARAWPASSRPRPPCRRGTRRRPARPGGRRNEGGRMLRPDRYGASSRTWCHDRPVIGGLDRPRPGYASMTSGRSRPAADWFTQRPIVRRTICDSACGVADARAGRPPRARRRSSA